MRSWVAKTEEIDDLEVAVEELKNGIPTEELLTNTVGIAYVYYDADFEELSKMLSETFQFPIIGGVPVYGGMPSDMYTYTL